ncbi:hypothetical protein [Sorangium sp. So ce233]|uniref:hypothetical protein n=1 Tax=Sorangium sp. So ce233 TaxID=3133290 RepID=UPI003F62DBBC
MAAKRTPKDNQDETLDSKVSSRAAVLRAATDLLESVRENISDEQRSTLLRAVGLMMDSGVEEGLIEAASEKIGKDVGKDMMLIRDALRWALTTIARHGEEGGAQQAKWFMDKMTKAAKEYSARTKLTHREAVLGTLKSLSHARTIDRRDVYSPTTKLLHERCFGTSERAQNLKPR